MKYDDVVLKDNKDIANAFAEKKLRYVQSLRMETELTVTTINPQRCCLHEDKLNVEFQHDSEGVGSELQASVATPSLRVQRQNPPKPRSINRCSGTWYLEPETENTASAR
ncbi:hypothetical protein ILUMI_10010 [Ignelater luminosus]|uniref:Uncharacterized protein n=1 Tax=Ignelater luminosus TaxID=2038154 RepID=A0A8K0D424_IGNLU|nr:hypothetical protein ILUMI_10010 [Ignelater luminosus]